MSDKVREGHRRPEKVGEGQRRSKEVKGGQSDKIRKVQRRL
jgi:hypothetical protein